MKILLPTDGSRYALAAARAISGWFAWPGGKVDVLAVVPTGPKSEHRDFGRDAQHEHEWRATVGEWLRATASHLDGSGLPVEELMREGDPATVAVEAAGAGYDLVAMGVKGRGATPRLAADSVARALLERAPTTVLLVRERSSRGTSRRLPTRQRPLRALLAVDGGAHSLDAARAFARVVAADHVRTTVLAVADAEQGGALSGRDAAAAAERVVTTLQAAGVAAESIVRDGKAVQEILAAAAEVDLVVLGSRAAGEEDGTRVGSVALGVAAEAPCSVLVVRGATSAAASAATEVEPEAVTQAEIAYEGVQPSPVVERYVIRGLRRLERVAPDLMRARVTVGDRQRRKHTGNLYDVRIELRRPGGNVEVSRTPPRHRESEDLATAIGEAFEKARRQLVGTRAVERGEVKTHEGKERGVVTELFPDYGFIRGSDGRIVYFHRKSVLEKAWDELETGAEVRFVDEPGDEGPQATTVTVGRRR